MNVYISLLSHYSGMVHSIDTIMSVNKFYMDEVRSRGYSVVLSPRDADIMLMLPTYQYDSTCMDEYNKYKNDLIILKPDQLEGVMMESCA